MMNDTISRAAAIDAVTCGALSAATLYGRTDAGTAALKETVRAIKALPSAQQWIPCEERLPEPGVNVLVDVLDIPAGDRFPLVDKIGDDGDWCNCYGEWFAVAWMPIPEPYREDTP